MRLDERCWQHSDSSRMDPCLTARKRIYAPLSKHVSCRNMAGKGMVVTRKETCSNLLVV